MPTATPQVYDDYIESGANADVNYGTSFLDYSELGGIKRHVLIGVPLTGITGLINSCTLDLHCFYQFGGAHTLTVQRVIHTSIVANVALLNSQSTWNSAINFDAWGTAGATNTTSDITTQNQITPAGPAATGAYQITGLGPMAQNAVDAGSPALIFLLSTAGAVEVAFESSEDANPALRPVMTFDYTPYAANRMMFYKRLRAA